MTQTKLTNFEKQQITANALHTCAYAVGDALFLAWRNATAVEDLVRTLYPAGEKRDELIEKIEKLIEATKSPDVYNDILDEADRVFRSAHGIAD